MNVYRLELNGTVSYYSSLAAIWHYNGRDALGVSYKQVTERGCPYRNARCSITKHQVFAKPHSNG